MTFCLEPVIIWSEVPYFTSLLRDLIEGFNVVESLILRLIFFNVNIKTVLRHDNLFSFTVVIQPQDAYL